MTTLNENELYAPVKNYLESLGYDVKGEVKHCDITAIKGDELIIVELKTGFTLELIYQALERQKIADGVYVAVPLMKKGYDAPRYKDMLYLCRRLSLGLIFVAILSSGKAMVDVAQHPSDVKAVRQSKNKRLAVINEHTNRTGSVNTGGVTRRKIITVYKEAALKIAACLEKNGELSTSDIRKETGIEKAASLLAKNFYQWYRKTENSTKSKNMYEITEEGINALKEYNDLLN